MIFENGEVYLDFNSNYLSVSKKNSKKVYKYLRNKNIMYKKEIKIFLIYLKIKNKYPKSFH